MEKATEAIKLHLPVSLKRAIQDAAMADDRSVSEYIRHVLTLHLHGVCGVAEREAGCNGAMRGEQGPLA